MIPIRRAVLSSIYASRSFIFNLDDELSSETYDANGNVTSTGGKSFTYDSENHLVSMSATGTSASIIYDAFGNRVSKTVNGLTTQYLVEDDKNPTGYPQVFDELTNGAVTRTYTYGLQRIDEEQVIDGAWTPSFYGYDGGGNVRNLTNSAGTVTDSYEFDAFGNKFTVSGTTPNNYLYRGEQYDPDLGLYYLRARYYNPLTGRFMSRDPEDGIDTDPGTLHKYIYAKGDPVNLADPTGKAAAAPTMPGAGGALGEYGLVTLGIAIRNTVAVAAVGAAVTCELNLAASYLNGISQNLGYKMTFERTGVCQETVKSCKTEYPNLLPIEEVPGWYEFESQGEAASALEEEVGGPVIPRKASPATSGPCPVGGQYEPGWHVNYQSLRGGGSGQTHLKIN